MADLNALIAQGAQFKAPPDPFAQYAQMQQLQQGRNQNELAQYTMSKARQEDVTRNAMNQAYQTNLNPETGEINYPGLYKSLAGANAGASIPGIQKTQFDTQKAKADLSKTQGETEAGSFKLKVDKANKAITDISALGSAEEAVASIKQHLAKGDIDQSKADALIAQLTQAPNFQTWRTNMVMGVLGAKDKLEATKPTPVEVTRADGSKIFLDKNPNSPTFNTEIMQKQAAGMTPFQKSQLGLEKERIGLGERRLDIAEAKADKGPELKQVPVHAQKAIVGATTAINKIDNAIAALEGSTDEATGMKGYLPDMALNRMYPKGTEARAAVADIGSLVMHERSGAAVTASESPRLKPFIPLITDDKTTALKKLKRMRQIQADDAEALAGTYNPEQGFREFRTPGGKAAAPAAPGGVDSSNPLLR